MFALRQAMYQSCLSLLKYSVSNLLLNIFRIQSTSTHTYCLFPTMLKNNFGINLSMVLSTWMQNLLRKKCHVDVYSTGKFLCRLSERLNYPWVKSPELRPVIQPRSPWSRRRIIRLRDPITTTFGGYLVNTFELPIYLFWSLVSLSVRGRRAAHCSSVFWNVY